MERDLTSLKGELFLVVPVRRRPLLALSAAVHTERIGCAQLNLLVFIIQEMSLSALCQNITQLAKRVLLPQQRLSALRTVVSRFMVGLLRTRVAAAWMPLDAFPVAIGKKLTV